MRGLKPVGAPFKDTEPRRTLTGAWIETVTPGIPEAGIQSRTLTGAWIETICLTPGIPCALVAPSRVRGLKLKFLPNPPN